MTRVSPTGHRLTRGRARLKEGSEAHLWVAVVRVGVDGVNGGELFCGHQSSGVHRTGATEHGVKIWWVCSDPGSALSAAVGSDACLHGSSRSGDMTDGEELSAPMATVARRRGRARGERGKGQGLTAIPAEATTRPGRGRSSRILGEIASGQRLKTRLGTTLQGFRRGVARWGGRGDRGGASERIGEARQWL